MAANKKPSLWQHAGMGFEFASSVVGMGVIGFRLDYWLDTQPWCLVAGELARSASPVKRECYT